MRQKIRWYVEAKDSYTNKVIQRELEGAELVHLKNEFGGKLLAYEVDHAFITKLKDSKNDLHLKFRVYKKQTLNSVAREFDFNFLTKKTKNKKMV
ncbi:hypothetical protein K9M50_01425 [Patescibacteria group bacterium]|nr:hypothetical protein [Patescibacteria group bacterium]